MLSAVGVDSIDGELFGVLGGGIELTGQFHAVECPFLTINDGEQRCEAP